MGKGWKVKGSRDIDKAFRRHPQGSVEQGKGSHKKGKLNGKTVMTYYGPQKEYPVGIRRKFEKKLTALGLIILLAFCGINYHIWSQVLELLSN